MGHYSLTCIYHMHTNIYVVKIFIQKVFLPYNILGKYLCKISEIYKGIREGDFKGDRKIRKRREGKRRQKERNKIIDRQIYRYIDDRKRGRTVLPSHILRCGIPKLQ